MTTISFRPVLMAIAMMLCTFSAYARSSEEARVAIQTVESGRKLVVKAWNLPADRSASIRVYNADGEMVYREAFKSGAYAKKYDLSQLQPGQYKLLLQSGTYSESERFEVLADGTVRVIENPSITNFSPVVIVRESKQMDVLIENRFSQKLMINLISRDGKVMYSAEVNPEDKFGSRLNLQHLPKDYYTLNISGGDYEFAKEISLF